MPSILFLNPSLGPRALYLNPIEIQRLAGAVAERFPMMGVTLIDLCAEDMPQDLPQASLEPDIICAALPSGSMSSALSALSTELWPTQSWLILVGEIVSDGNPLQALEFMLNAGWRRDRTIAFVGREEEQFAHAIKKIIEGGEPRSLPNVASLDGQGNLVVDESQRFPETFRRVRPLFNYAIKHAIADRGPRILIDGLSRGCEHRCLYCHLNNRKQTSTVVQEIEGEDETIQDLEKWYGKSVVLQFTDENFFGGADSAANKARLERVRRLGRSLASRKFTGILGVDTRIDTVFNDRDDVKMDALRESAWRAMVDGGLKHAYLGTESFSKTQLRRYGKAEQLKIVPAALRRLRTLKVEFMAGLIIFDPLVTPAEIEESIEFIETYRLFGNVASLLKEMRIQSRSQYYKLLETRHSSIRAADKGMLMLARESVPYIDPVIQTTVGVTRKIHTLFSESGYRHSDAAAFEVLLSEIPNDFGISVPNLVAQMEARLLRSLIQGSVPPDISWAYALAEDCAGSVLDYAAEKSPQADTIGSQKVLRYYISVFKEIKSKAAQFRADGG